MYGWRVLDTAPAVLLLQSPSLKASGSRFAVFRFGVNASYAGVDGITYSVLLTNDPFLGQWHTPDVCGGTLPDAVSVTQRDCVSQVCSFAGCAYTVSLPDSKEYTLRARTNFAANSGPELQITWTHVRCGSTQFSVVSGNDTVTCHDCPTGGNCTLPLTTAFSESNPSGSQSLVAFIVQEQDIVAMPGFWTFPASASGSRGASDIGSSTPDGQPLQFYACLNAFACLPGPNGSRVVCSVGYRCVPFPQLEVVFVMCTKMPGQSPYQPTHCCAHSRWSAPIKM